MSPLRGEEGRGAPNPSSTFARVWACPLSVLSVNPGPLVVPSSLVSWLSGEEEEEAAATQGSPMTFLIRCSSFLHKYSFPALPGKAPIKLKQGNVMWKRYTPNFFIFFIGFVSSIVVGTPLEQV